MSLSRARVSLFTVFKIVMDLLRRLAVECEAAIIAVTHDEKIFDRFDRIFRLRDGRLEDDGDSPRA